MELADLAHLIRSRRSIRSWQHKEVSEALLLQAVELATWAPNGGNQQNWHFYVIVNRDTTGAIAEWPRHYPRRKPGEPRYFRIKATMWALQMIIARLSLGPIRFDKRVATLFRARCLLRGIWWLSNTSSGIPHRLRLTVEAILRLMLTGLGLGPVFTDVVCTELARVSRLLETSSNHIAYSNACVESYSTCSLVM